MQNEQASIWDDAPGGSWNCFRHREWESQKGPAAVPSGASVSWDATAPIPATPPADRPLPPFGPECTPASVVVFSVPKVFVWEPASPHVSGGLGQLASNSLTLSFLTFKVGAWIPGSNVLRSLCEQQCGTWPSVWGVVHLSQLLNYCPANVCRLNRPVPRGSRLSEKGTRADHLNEKREAGALAFPEAGGCVGRT